MRCFLVLCLFPVILAACAPISISATLQPAEAEPSATFTPIPTFAPTASPTQPPTTAPLPTQTATATLAPIGEIQNVSNGYVYLGDRKTVALGFNLNAGGAIGSLLYDGKEFVDDADFGRYIQFSPYDGDDTYICNPPDCFDTWGWNPLQAGSADGVPAKVQEYRRWTNGLYIKALGVEWGKSLGISDVTYETWAWDRGGFFEVHTRLTHTGADTHALAGAEFPAAYFGAAIPLEYGYTEANPFTADEIQLYDMVTGDMNENTNPNVYPTENWMAFGDGQGNGLILALPPQPKLSPEWSVVFIRNAYPSPIGYIAPFANLETLPSTVHDLTYYLIPGPIEQGRSIVYDLIPHTTWTFDLNSAEGWFNSGRSIEVTEGVLITNLSANESLTSMPGLNFYGSQAPVVEFTARTQTGSVELCLKFITSSDWAWNAANSSCAQVQPGGFKNYRFDFSTNPEWMNGLVTQLQLTTLTPVALEIDKIRVDRQIYGWEFYGPHDIDGWVAWNHLMPLQIRNGSMFSTSTGDDPYMGSPYLGIDAAEFSRIEIRMQTSAGNDAQVFFVTDQDPGWDEVKSRHFSIISDGSYHVYTIDISAIAAWKNRIQQIRLDPMVAPGDFEIDYIRVMRP